ARSNSCCSRPAGPEPGRSPTRRSKASKSSLRSVMAGRAPLRGVVMERLVLKKKAMGTRSGGRGAVVVGMVVVGFRRGRRRAIGRAAWSCGATEGNDFGAAFVWLRRLRRIVVLNFSGHGAKSLWPVSTTGLFLR